MRKQQLSWKATLFSGHTMKTVVVMAAMLAITAPATAQTFRVIHTFSGGGADGGNPYAGLSIDRAGNLYGTTTRDTVFQMANLGRSWRFTSLHIFTGGSDGAYPIARVVLGPDGKVYGTTFEGGGSTACPSGCGTVFRLAPPTSACHEGQCPQWSETILYRFGMTSDPADGAFPASDLVFDNDGNLYGTTDEGGGGGLNDSCDTWGCGSVFQLSRSQGSWTRTTLYSFVNGDDRFPHGGLIFDHAGNLYGATATGVGSEMYGTVYQLTPGNPNWSRNILHSFTPAEGWGVVGDLIWDSAGNLYGAAPNDGAGGKGMAFQMSPSGSGWDFNVIYSFPIIWASEGGPLQGLTMDQQGNLYGTTYTGGSGGEGNVFKLTPSNGSWIYTSLHDFTGLNGDGANPISNVVIDAAGNLYGTTAAGGNTDYPICNLGCGVVWEITP